MANNSYISNQQQQQQQQQQTEDNDENATNCSETMSTTNEDEECFEAETQHQQQPPLLSATQTGAEDLASTSGLLLLNVSVEGSKKREEEAEETTNTNANTQKTMNGDIQEHSGINTQAAAIEREGEGEGEPLTNSRAIASTMTNTLETDGGSSSSSSGRSVDELSLASGNTQAPPSYGTATRICATLDVGQLCQQQQQSLSAATSNNNTLQHAQNPAPNSSFRFHNASTTIPRSLLSPAHYSDSLFSSSQQQQQQQQSAANHYSSNYSSSANVQMHHQHQPLFNGPMTTIEGGFNAPSTMMRVPRTQSFESHNMQQQQLRTIHQNQKSNLLAVGGSLPRSSFLALAQQQQQQQINGLSQNISSAIPGVSGQNLTNSRIDNNQNSEFRSWLKLQQQQQVGGNFELPAPINHVISANGSIQWQRPQTNQCYTPAAAATVGSSNCTITTSSSPVGAAAAAATTSSQQLCGNGARLSLKSARIMDGQIPFPCPSVWQPITAAAAATSQGQQDQQQQQLATNRNELGGGGGDLVSSWQGLQASSISVPSNTTNISQKQQQQQPLEPLDNQLQRDLSYLRSKNNQRLSNQALSIQQQQQQLTTATATTTNNNSAAVRQLLMLQSSKESPTRRSYENLAERSSRTRNQQQQQQAHRKRRRHRSTSGRSVSPDSGQVAAAAASSTDQQAGFVGGCSERLARPTNHSFRVPSSLAAVADKTAEISADKVIAGSRLPPQRGAGNQQKISAHCWLIDSSDDQTYGPTDGGGSSSVRKYQSSTLSSKSHKLAEGKNIPKTHLTVAMMKQTLEQEKLRSLQQHQQPEPFNQIQNHSINQYHSSKSLIQQAATATTTVVPVSLKPEVDDESDLTKSLRTNSLRMERILNRNNEMSRKESKQVLMVNSRSGTMPNAQHRRNKHRRYSSSSSSPVSPTSSISGHNYQRSGDQVRSHKRSRESTNIGSVTRLSALLSVLSNLVTGRSNRSSRCSSLRPPPIAPQTNDESFTQPEVDFYPPVPANSISGSISLQQNNRSVAPYTTCNGSLAISSSSSTSAYATESSHLSHSSGNGRSNNNFGQFLNNSSGTTNSAHSSSEQRPMPMALLKHQIPPPSSASTAGSSLFYSSTSGNSGFQMSTSGSHSYEYCDDDRLTNETRFVQQLAISEEQTQVEGNSNRSQTSSTSTNTDNSNEDFSNEPSSLVNSNLKGLNRQQAAAAIMSDNELLSAGSEAGGFRSGASGGATNTLAAVVSQATPSMARRRWWWISLKDHLCRRPCATRSEGSSLTADSEEGALASDPPVQPYKSLKSRSRNRQGGTLKNVLSLAKADRVFRTRLLASLVVSCILLGLIGLLCGLIYSRSNSMYQRNRLGLLIDDSDYDLSWLWPQDNSLGINHFPRELTGSTRYRMIDLQLAKNPAEQLMMDGSLRGPLLMIEQSDRLTQYQQTIAHLTNLQLARDNFIDLTRLAQRLNPNNEVNVDETFSSPPPPPPSNSTSGGESTSGSGSDGQTKRFKQEYQLQLTSTERDLISLTLLSNLHWPLVKWRHQNQQSVANFLSFAVPSAGAVQPHLRSLLSVLLLAEASPELPLAANNNSNLIQFSRLNSLLRSSSYHIVSCSHYLTITSQAAATEQSRSGNGRTTSLRFRFCEQLVAKYKRMMFTLSQLNHSQLVKLRDPMEPPPTVSEDSGSNTNGPDQPQFAASSRTLLSFFLDRLALLDIQTLAESTLASADPEVDEIFEDFSAPSSASTTDGAGDSELDGSSSSSSSFSWESRAFASILMVSNVAEQESSFTRSSGGSLLDFAKLIMADGQSHMNSAGADSDHSEWGQHLQHLEAENNDAWRQLLSRDLLYPWASQKLPRFVAPLNYDLFLHPNLTTKLVLGMVKINFRLNRPTRFIVMHCDKLNLVDVSLWMKQDSPFNNINNNNQTSSDSLRRVPIRRVLKHPKYEQLYIELQHQVNPYSLPVTKTPLRNYHQHNVLNFGGELPSLEMSTSQNEGAIFILSISFNKTSLMQQTGSNSPLENGQSPEVQNFPEHGLEFVQYTDYFAPQSEAELKTLLYTQFEPQNARRLFPSFDEPQFKAKFQLNLVHEQTHQVLFNAPKRERVPYTADGAHQMSVFETTPIPLSTYLVAFVVCDSQNIKSITSRVSQLQLQQQQQVASVQKIETKHIQVQVLAQFEQLSQAEFASQLVPQLLAFYQNHLNFPYPVDKLDLVAIPRAMPPAINAQTNGGSTNQQEQLPLISSISQQQQQQRLNTMENMGLIWFKANLLLVDTNLISQNLIEQVAMIISHQLAHQYFGNIVTISKWDDLWLYESLCQYLESVALSNVQPDWRLEEQFVVSSIQDTLALEQFNSPASNSAKQQQQQQLIKSNSAEQLININKGDQKLTLDADFSSSGAAGEEDELEASLDLSTLLSATNSQLGSSLSSADQSTVLEPSENNKFGFSSSLQGTLSSASNLRRSSALVHMLLFNLLPSQEARARLLRRCLSLFRYGTMSRGQFWRQFGEQLAQEGSSERLALALDISPPPTKPLTSGSVLSLDTHTSDQLSLQTSDRWRNFTISEHNHQTIAASAPSSERVVFVRNYPNKPDKIGGDYVRGGGDAHRIQVRSADRLTQNLEATVEAWLDKSGYPLITASINRDRIHLKQERFSFNWWNEPGLVDDDEPIASSEALQMEQISSDDIRTEVEPAEVVEGRGKRELQEEFAGPIWPIPLMLVSRINQKQARFLWMDKREMEIPLQELSYSSPSILGGGSDFSQLDFSASPMELRKGYLNVWFKLNVNQSSLIRVNYDERNWEALTELMLKSHYSNHLLSPLDRANLIDDSFTLMRCGKLSVGIAMNLTLYLEVGEREFMPWTSALKHLDQMQTLLNQNPLWHRYVLKLMQPISSVIGWKDDGPHLMRKLRRSLFSVALQYGDERTVNKAKQEFKGWFKNGRFIVPNLQELVYVAGVRYGDQQEWFHCWQKYTQLVGLELGSGLQNKTDLDSLGRDSGAGDGFKGGVDGKSLLAASVGATPISANSMMEQNEPNSENEKRQLLTALASTQNTWLLEQFLNYSLDSTKIQPHHLKHVMQTLGKNPVARLYLWRFVRLNWNTLVERYIDNSFTADNMFARNSGTERARRLRDNEYQQVLATMIVESTKHFVTKLDYDEVKTFFEMKRKQHKLRSSDASGWSSSLEGAIQQSLQVIRANIYWRNYIEPKLTKWLSHYDSSIIN